MLAQIVRAALPYACAATGGVWSERSGIINIALEGILLVGGAVAIATHLETGSPWAGVLAGAAAGGLVALAHALIVELGRVDAIVSGIGLNLFASGATRFLIRALYASSSNTPAVRAFGGTSAGSSAGAMSFVHALIDPLTLVTLGSVLSCAWILRRTRFGLRVRASGEDPRAAASAGVDVARVRIAAVTIGGAIAGLGGVALAYDQHRFQSDMSAGRGFIALAAVILSRWRPVQAALLCLGFAALEAVQVGLQTSDRDTAMWVLALPYVATLGALVWMSVRRTGAGPPAGLGQHVD